MWIVRLDKSVLVGRAIFEAHYNGERMHLVRGGAVVGVQVNLQCATKLVCASDQSDHRGLVRLAKREANALT